MQKQFNNLKRYLMIRIIIIILKAKDWIIFKFPLESPLLHAYTLEFMNYERY